MKKLTYIQPKTSMAVMPQFALMAFNNSPGEQYNPASKRRMDANPAIQNADSTKVF